MTLRIGILLLGALVTAASAQNPDVIDNTRNTLQNLSTKQAIDRNQALAAAGQAQKPASAQPAAGVAPQSVPQKKKTKTIVATQPSPAPKREVAVEDKKNPEESKKRESREYSAAGRRDPFVSPIITHIAGGSGCNTGKRCLTIGQITLTGIVKSDSGMIAVVVNAMKKAYFLRENDPVFNGYVVKITGDSVIFSETGQDQLGKPFTREITKKISTPA
jgi:Tfp pilus assembly protein PilP